MRRTALAMATALLLGGPALAAAPEGDTGAATVHPELWPAATSPAAITDAAPEARIDALIARMTIEQKFGQLIQAASGHASCRASACHDVLLPGLAVHFKKKH